MKFDCVIANPPFSIPGASNLHLQVIDSVIKSGALEEGWAISTIQPIAWLLRNVNVMINKGDYKEFESLRSCISRLGYLTKTESCELFGINIRDGLGVYYLQDGADDGDKVVREFRKKYGRLDETTFIEKVVLATYNEKHPSFSDAIVLYNKDIKYYVKWSGIHGNPDRRDYFDVMSPVKKYTREDAIIAGEKDKNGKVANKTTEVFAFETDEEAENFRKSVVGGVFYKYVSWCYKSSLHVHANKNPWMGEAINPRTGIKGYKGAWTDDDLFEYFGITQEERNIICEKMKEHLYEGD